MPASNLPDALWASLEEEVAAALGYAGDDMEVNDAAGLEEADVMVAEPHLEADVADLEADDAVVDFHLQLPDADNNPDAHDHLNAPDHPNMLIDFEIAEFFEDGFGVGEWFDLVGDDGDEEEEDDPADENVVVNGWWVHLLPPPPVPAPLLFGFVFPPGLVAPLAGEPGSAENPLVID